MVRRPGPASGTEEQQRHGHPALRSPQSSHFDFHASPRLTPVAVRRNRHKNPDASPLPQKHPATEPHGTAGSVSLKSVTQRPTRLGNDPRRCPKPPLGAQVHVLIRLRLQTSRCPVKINKGGRTLGVWLRCGEGYTATRRPPMNFSPSDPLAC